ncbi:MAG TPA: YncE family protein, partial [Casimicrobiaceae bacterium]|nr:YncE family protein [Casimicrobiaceae bacterium]
MLKVSVPFLVAVSLALPSFAFGEILAMVNYETKSPDSLKALKSPIATPARKEGIAIIDVDPMSKNFGKILQDIALPGDLVAHHIFYNRDQSKAYVTALGKPELRVIDMKKEPYSISKVVAVPGCIVGEDVVFSDDGNNWYLTCMGAQAMVVGDAKKDEPIKTIKVAAPYPHGIAIHNGIDRILLSSTVRASDLGDAGENISAVEASSGKVLGTYKVSNKPSPA